MKNNYLSGVIFCLIATLSWGAMFPVMASALQHVDPFHFTAARYALAGIAFALLLLVKGTEAFRSAPTSDTGSAPNTGDA